MNLEEMLRHEREVAVANPLLDRTDQIISRVRGRRRARAAAAGVASLLMLTVVAGVAVERLPADGSPAEPAPNDAVPLLEVPADSPLDPGRYLVSVADAPSAPLVPVMSVPEGYEGIEGGIGVRTDDFSRYVWVWDVDSVYGHPCDALVQPTAVGSSVADLADALAAQQLRDGADPVAVSVGGYDGLYLELTVPDDVDFSACRQQAFSLWPGRGQQVPGQVDMVWILDVEGQRIVFDASYDPTVDADDVDELKEMVTTATFAPGDGD